MVKKINSRIIHKHDIEANWLKVRSDYVPDKGELIIYDVEVDANGNVLELPSGRTVHYTYERFKIGDGITTLGNLPFVVDDNVQIPIATSSDGIAFTVTAPGITTLRCGTSISVMPTRANTDTAPTLNVNNLGAKTIKRRQSDSSNPTSVKPNILKGGAPVRLIYDGAYWILENTMLVSASDVSGTVDWASKAVLDPNGNPLMGYVKEVTAEGNTLTVKAGSGATSTITLDTGNIVVVQIPVPQRIMHTDQYEEHSLYAMKQACDAIKAAEDAGKTVLLTHRSHTYSFYTLNYSHFSSSDYDRFIFFGFDPDMLYTDEYNHAYLNTMTYLEYDYSNNSIIYSNTNPVTDSGDWMTSLEDYNGYVDSIPSFNAIYLACKAVLEEAKAYTREYVGAIPNAEEGSF